MFHRLSPDECANVTIDSQVWTQYTRWKYNNATGKYYYDDSFEARNTTNYKNAAYYYPSTYQRFLDSVAAQLKAEDKEVIFGDE